VSKLEKVVNNLAIFLLLSLVGVFFVSMYKSDQLKKEEKRSSALVGLTEMRAIALKIDSLQKDLREIKKNLVLQGVSPRRDTLE
jgi:hypothetical protein